jgi:hypothetical protein
MGNNPVQRFPVTVVERPAGPRTERATNSMTAPIHIAVEQHLPVSVRDGFDYITDPANWREYGPRLVPVDSATRWREPGDRAYVVQRILGREVELDMTLVRNIEPYRLVEYTST